MAQRTELRTEYKVPSEARPVSPGVPRVVGYVRVSTDEQAETGYSLPDQRDKIARYCQEHGFILIDVISDDFTGKLLERPGLERVSELAQDGRFDLLVCVKIDRLARINYLRRQYEEWLQERGIQVQFVQQRFESTAAGRLQRGIMGEFAEYESELIRERTMSGRIRKAREGKALPVYSRTYGYRQVSKSEAEVILEYRGRSGDLIVIEEEATLVRRIFELCAAGHTLSGIAERLRDEGLRTRAGDLWSPNSLRNMLRNETYIGRLYYGRREYTKLTQRTDSGAQKRKMRVRPRSEWIPIAVPAIVAEGIFASCQQRLDENQERLRGRPSLAWPLHGSIFCAVCKTNRGTPRACAGTISRNPNTYNRYYRCTSRKRLDIEDCRTCVNADDIEKVALDALRRAATPDRLAQVARQAAELEREKAGHPEQDIARLQHALADLEQEERRIADLLLAGISRHIVAEKIGSIQERREQYTEQMAQARRRASFASPKEAAQKAEMAAARLRDALPGAERDPKLLQHLFHLFLEVYVYRDRLPEIRVRVPEFG